MTDREGQGARAVDVRALLGWQQGYETLCREERNVAAIFYHLLATRGNLRRFLQLADCGDLRVADDELASFFEYAYLRDLWAARARDEHAARRVVLEHVRPPASARVEGMSVLEFNTFFGASPKPSARFIQAPGNWSIRRFKENIADDELFLRVCKFKWSFNAKPDIVIHTDHRTALCIEAKFDSGEGHYPAVQAEKAEFKRRGLSYVGQTELQQFMMTKLLGLDARFVFLVRDAKARSASHRTVTWAEAFSALDVSASPRFVREWAARLGGGR